MVAELQQLKAMEPLPQQWKTMKATESNTFELMLGHAGCGCLIW